MPLFKKRFYKNNSQMKKGGKRKDSGRKPVSYQTKTIAFRVRLEWVEAIKSTVKGKIIELQMFN